MEQNHELLASRWEPHMLDFHWVLSTLTSLLVLWYILNYAIQKEAALMKETPVVCDRVLFLLPFSNQVMLDPIPEFLWISVNFLMYFNFGQKVKNRIIMDWDIWKRNNSRSTSYKYSHGTYVSTVCGSVFLQKIKKGDRYRIYSIIYYCWFLFNNLKEKVSHLWEKQLSKHLGLYIGQKMEIIVFCRNLSHLKRQKERGKKKQLRVLP